jgi:hypothetical protein
MIFRHVLQRQYNTINKFLSPTVLTFDYTIVLIFRLVVACCIINIFIHYDIDLQIRQRNGGCFYDAGGGYLFHGWHTGRIEDDAMKDDGCINNVGSE